MLGPQRSGFQMKLLDALVEQRIAAAAARGEFEDVPGTAALRPQDDDALVPEEVRIANRILKNAGFVPPAVEQLRARIVARRSAGFAARILPTHR